MPIFTDSKAAKEYLVSQIVEEAQRESVPLSEIERKMLFSPNNYWSLPDIMEVNAQFEKEYDSEEYEAKISELIRTPTTEPRRNPNPKPSVGRKQFGFFERKTIIFSS